MGNSYRLPQMGAQIDRNQIISFKFDGRSYQGFQGDTLASALLANGVHLMGRSFKYHRPRGCLTAGSEEPNALVELGDGDRREPNTRATMIELFEGLEATSQNRFPSLKYDIQSINQLFSPFLTAGFYYKTFMWPASFWEPIYEKFIRKSAGLGRAATAPDPDIYEHAHAHCDVLIVGAGAAGLAAARSAAKTGARVILVEEKSYIGGMSSPTQDVIDGINAKDWFEQILSELKTFENVTFLPRTTLFGCYDHNVLAAVERVSDHLANSDPKIVRQRLWVIRAKQVVLACGSQERPLIFEHNDRPGIMLASAAKHFIEQFGVCPGRRIILTTNNDSVYDLAALLLDLGVKIVAILDVRTALSAAASKLAERNLRIMTSTVPFKAHGRLSVKALTVESLENGLEEKLTCDCVLMSGGFSADVHLSSQTGAKPNWDSDIQSFVPDTPLRAERSAGAGNGVFDLKGCLETGHEAGIEAAQLAGFDAKPLEPPKADLVRYDAVAQIEDYKSPDRGMAFVDFQNDVTAKDIMQAHLEGFTSVEHAKRYTTLGMATDQGKTSNVNGLAVLAQASGLTIDKVGTTRFRPPYSPVAIGAFAGHLRGKDFQPVRRTAMHDCSQTLGAVFIEAGLWLRPQYYPKYGETIAETIYREAKQVRQTAGICDVSSLGKIDIFGADAGDFLNQIYINGWKSLKIGFARYGVMLREDGYVLDDGTTSRLADDHYFMTTTTANAARVLAHLEHASQVLWPDLDVHFCSATEQWCGVAVAGPNARKILAKAFGDALDISDENLPFMGVRSFTWLGTTARIFRISFSGELAFEVNVPWNRGEAMWNTLWEAGQDFGLIPYGTEALGVLRIEKGHVSGQELDGRTTAQDLGLGKMMSSKKSFIGQKMAAREGMVADDRATLVGMKLTEAPGRLRGGAHLVADKNNANSYTDLGWVTSVCHSPAMGCWIGLGFLKGGLSVYEGQTLYAVSPLHNESVRIEICSPHFYDPEGARLYV